MSYKDPKLNFPYKRIDFEVFILVVKSGSLLIRLYKGIFFEFHFSQISLIRFLPSEIEGKEI